jgi:glycosyltransferase involved in cell wall biosynthesis
MKFLPKAYVFYHYFNPDGVVSSVLVSELCSGLVERGWEVTAFPSARAYGNPSDQYPKSEVWNGVKVERIWRPGWSQDSSIGRVLNALWMIGRWAMLASQRRHHPDVVILGTDPILSVLLAPVWRFFKPKTAIAHWCFDLYPEAAFADGVLHREGFAARVLQRLLKRAYRACDLVVDIGPCMRELLLRHDANLQCATLVPWALAEPHTYAPIAQDERAETFGPARLALMYSGSFGRAHGFEDMLELSRLLRDDDVHVVFSVKGNREQDLRAAVQPEDTNIRFVPFADSARLEERLASADIHIVSLREDWTGTVIPSKFFGVLAIGRPVLFCGSRSSAIARWIEEYDLGWVLTPGEAPAVAAAIRIAMSDDTAMREMRERCYRVYHQQFSKKITIDAWNHALHGLVEKI